jgi:GNAT superfamily N-acetyltransferase
MDGLRIVPEHATPGNTIAQLEEALFAHNGQATGLTAWQNVLFCLRDEAQTLRGGLSGFLWGGWLHVNMLWVHDALRGRGFGQQLLSAAEQYALAQGCTDAYLNTFDFQAPTFYRKRGYTCFGELSDSPRGHTHYFLRKRLTPLAQVE